MNKNIIISFIAFCSFSCAPSLGSGVSVNAIPDDKVTQLESLADSNIKLNVQPFRDGRENRWIARVNEQRKVGPLGDIGQAVQTAFRRQLTQNGIKISPLNSYTIDGTVTEWQLDVNVGFPTTRADAHAVIEVNLFTPDKRAILTGTYRGSSSLEHPFIEDKLEEVLGEAMGFAITEALSDPKLMQALRANS